jgi:acyl-CoA reductase-like NAD-dependent aldehyde dehydrogenase
MLFFPCPVSFEAFGCGWNFDVSPVCVVLSMDPLIGAISAGCAIVLKPSEVAPATSALLAKLIPLYLDSSLIRVVEGAIPETQALLQQKWDKIFYTGSYTFDNNLAKLSLATLSDRLLGELSPLISAEKLCQNDHRFFFFVLQLQF